MRVENGSLRPGGPNLITGPSTIQTFSAIGFRVLIGA